MVDAPMVRHVSSTSKVTIFVEGRSLSIRITIFTLPWGDGGMRSTLRFRVRQVIA
jgi:hypothetical protein